MATARDWTIVFRPPALLDTPGLRRHRLPPEWSGVVFAIFHYRKGTVEGSTASRRLLWWMVVSFRRGRATVGVAGDHVPRKNSL